MSQRQVLQLILQCRPCIIVMPVSAPRTFVSNCMGTAWAHRDRFRHSMGTVLLDRFVKQQSVIAQIDDGRFVDRFVGIKEYVYLLHVLWKKQRLYRRVKLLPILACVHNRM